MDLDNIEKRFGAFLYSSWQLSDVAPFNLAYIRLVTLFKEELSEVQVKGLLLREKCLRGEVCDEDALEELRNSSWNEMKEHLKNNASATRAALLNRLIWGALLDSGESDFFYITEPLFDFARGMRVSPDQLQQILESEFVGFKM
jgi:hypothetical protein